MHFKLQFKSYQFILISLVLISSITAQDSTLFLGTKKFTKENNKWFVNSEGTKYAVDMNSITVKLKDNIPTQVLENVLKNTGIKIERENMLGYIDLELSESRKFYKWHEHLAKMGIFESVEVNSFGKVYSNDPGLNSQYYLHDTGTFPKIFIIDPYCWAFEDGSTNPVTVAVLDDGIDFNHIDLNADENNDYDYVDGDLTPQPDNNGGYIEETHGTAIAGIIAAKTYNGIGIAGIAGGYNSGGTKIMALRIAEGKLEDGKWAIVPNSEYVDDAIIHAANNGARVINMSIDVSSSSSINAAIDYAYKHKNCVLVAATGNNDDEPIGFPANHNFVIAVSGIRQDWTRYGNNSNGDPDLVAPARYIYTTLLTDINDPLDDDRCGEISGTSFAAPQVAGVAALLISSRLHILNFEVRNIINETAVNKKPDLTTLPFDYFGNGVLHAGYALAKIDTNETGCPIGVSNVSITAINGYNPKIHWGKVEWEERGQTKTALNYNIYRATTTGGRYNYSKVATVSGSSSIWIDNTITVAQSSTEKIYYRVSYMRSSTVESLLSDEVSCGSDLVSKELAEDNNELQKKFKVFDNYPNPFNPSTTISFALPENAFVTLRIYNILGELITELANEQLDTGIYDYRFNADNLPSGIYLYRLTVNQKLMAQKKMILLK